MRKLLFLLAMLCAGCASNNVTNVVWCHDWDKTAVQSWDKQIKSRWPDRKVVALFCHGGDVVEKGKKLWLVFPDAPRHAQRANDVADTLHAARPGALVVLISCNPGAAPCTVPDTAYADDYVWITAGPDFNFDWREGH